MFMQSWHTAGAGHLAQQHVLPLQQQAAGEAATPDQVSRWFQPLLLAAGLDKTALTHLSRNSGLVWAASAG